MTLRILVLGGGGMLGHKLFQQVSGTHPETWCTIRGTTDKPPLQAVELFQSNQVISSVDVLQPATLRDLLRRLRPHVIVNCVGVIKQRDAAKAAIPTIRINALLPHELAELCLEWGGRLIHFSTDCVFSGRRGNYRETDVTDAEDLYGRTKYLGEVVAPNAVTLRTSIIGREISEHRSLLDWFLFQHSRAVRGFRRVIYSGITTNEMAKVVAMIINDYPQLSGLFQVVSEPISKYDLLSLVRDAYQVPTIVEPYDGEVSDRSMCGDKFHEATGWRAPSWPEMIAALAADPTPYAAWSAATVPTPAE